MEVGSFIGAAAVTGGQIRIRNAHPQGLGMIAQIYRRLGVCWQVEEEAGSGESAATDRDAPRAGLSLHAEGGLRALATR